MATPILMPKQGNTVEECILIAWKKKPGDEVSEGDIIAEIETDKATFELESPASGELIGTFCEEGDLVPVLTNIGVIGKKGEDIEAFRPSEDTPAEEVSVSSAPSEPSAAAPAATTATASAPVTKAEAESVPQAKTVSPRAKKLAERYGISTDAISGTGPGGRVIEADIRAYRATAPRLSSLAKELVKDGYRMPQKGTGIGGMVLSGDLGKPGIPLSNMRSIIASRMMESLQEAAQFTLNASAPAAPLLAARKEIKAQKGKPGFVDVNLNDMLMYITTLGLAESPDVNAELIDNKIYQHDDVDIAFACDTPKGLLVPVIKEAQKLSLPELATRLKTYAQEAVNGNISPDLLSGGSFTVSNLGNLGIESFTPIINAPQVAILGVCAIGLKPVKTSEGVQFVDHIGLSLTIDHQAIDGAVGARFLKKLVERISTFKLSTEISHV
ncbi:MAG: 2-oxo acid dehydrogenase subunit E2 [Fibrobacteria bacterium]|nr:2-oxo acid dehydrogenase subunit E2 [Fibrobacteria bacterium]